MAAMHTIDKALGLLALFSEQRPSIGLSEFARMTRFDKATTHRYLGAMLRAGFLEQDPQTRAYRLGPNVVRLARVREVTHPVEAVVQPVLARLAKATGETSHFSMICGKTLATLGVAESRKVHRIIIENGELLPFHATSSGLAFLAFAAPGLVETVLAAPLTAFTPATITDPARIRSAIAACRRTGYVTTAEGFEEGVFSIAAPVFNPDDGVCGAVAVAAPLSRRRQASETAIRDAVRAAAAEITRALGGDPGKAAAVDRRTRPRSGGGRAEHAVI